MSKREGRGGGEKARKRRERSQERERETERENNDNAIQRKIQWKFEIDRNAATCDTYIRIRVREWFQPRLARDGAYN